jgi:hypothetical protein
MLKLRQCRSLPRVASVVYPTFSQLLEGIEWYKGATRAMRDDFIAQRLKVIDGFIDPVPFHCFDDKLAVLLTSSGSTGRRKVYKWGPRFHAINQAYFHYVMDRLKFTETMLLIVLNVRDIGEPHSMNLIGTMSKPRPEVTKRILIDVNGPQGRIPDLKEILYQKNVAITPSNFEILDARAGFLDDLTPGCSILFTGEALPADMKAMLIERGFDVRDYMRCWDGGVTFFTCRHGNRHWIEMFSDFSVNHLDQLVATDLFNCVQPFQNYWNGDLLTWEPKGRCRCGMTSYDIEFKNRLEKVYVKTCKGHSVNFYDLRKAFLNVTKMPDASVMLVTFGFNLMTPHWIKVDYVIQAMNYQLQEEIERRVEEGFREQMGFTDFAFNRTIMPSQYKLKRIYFVEAGRSMDEED